MREVGFIDRLDYLFINNVGVKIPENQFDFTDKIIITNFSDKTDLFETSTLKRMYFWALMNPNDKILYLHTKGVSYTKEDSRIRGIRDWVDFMLYCNVHHHQKCIEMLDYVDVVGCDYRSKIFHNGDPNHYSGNYWWATAKYIKSLSIYELNEKYDAEWWLFRNNPTFVNIHKCPYGHYENPYPKIFYVDAVDGKVDKIIDNLKNLEDLKIFYGIEGNYQDVTNICHEKLITDNILTIPAGDGERNQIFGDHIHGVVKHIKIGLVEHSFYEEIRYPIQFIEKRYILTKYEIL
ncbi:Hypothetical protein HVR_LOCUS125 [uncultured virus]|nr:Hypothetical protein HVR_LOCUS125 [uncultured virus]